jgi:hypothetical protein
VLLLCLVLSSPPITVAQGVIPVVPPTDETVESVEADESSDGEIASAPEAEISRGFLATVVGVGMVILVAAYWLRRNKGKKLNLETGEPE